MVVVLPLTRLDLTRNHLIVGLGKGGSHTGWDKCIARVCRSLDHKMWCEQCWHLPCSSLVHKNWRSSANLVIGFLSTRRWLGRSRRSFSLKILSCKQLLTTGNYRIIWVVLDWHQKKSLNTSWTHILHQNLKSFTSLESVSLLTNGMSF